MDNFNPHLYESEKYPRRISSLHSSSTIDGTINDNSNWIEDVISFLPYQILINYSLLEHHQRYSDWIRDNCSGWWTNSAMISGHLLKKNNKNMSHIPPGLIGIMTKKGYYCFQKKNDAIIFKLYIEG